MATRAGAPSALVLFAHGSRDAQWAEPFRAIQRRLAVRQPNLQVELAFLELTPPTLAQTIERLADAGHTRLTVAPLFMGQGAHVKRDLTDIVSRLRQRYPALDLTLLPAAGEVDEVLDAITNWLVRHA